MALVAGPLFCADLLGERPSDLDAAEAHRHIGETRTVCGEVASTHHDADSEGGPTFLNLGRPHPRQVLTVVIWRQDREKFQRPPEHYYADRRICVTGPITLRDDVPRIVVGDPTQIEIVRESEDRSAPGDPEVAPRDPEAAPSAPPVTVCHWDAVRESITLCTDRPEPVDLGGWILTDGEGTYVIPRARPCRATGTGPSPSRPTTPDAPPNA